jgi:hypothetical protein
VRPGCTGSNSNRHTRPGVGYPTMASRFERSRERGCERRLLRGPRVRRTATRPSTRRSGGGE